MGQAQAGRSDEARLALIACWHDTGKQDAAQRCVLAHLLADQELKLDAEMAWDEKALDAHLSGE